MSPGLGDASADLSRCSSVLPPPPGLLVLHLGVHRTEVKHLTASKSQFCSFKRALNRWISTVCVIEVKEKLVKGFESLESQ